MKKSHLESVHLTPNKRFECELDEFISCNQLDERCINAVKTARHCDVQIVMDQGFNVRARNPSAVVMKRLNDAVKAAM